MSPPQKSTTVGLTLPILQTNKNETFCNPNVQIYQIQMLRLHHRQAKTESVCVACRCSQSNRVRIFCDYENVIQMPKADPSESHPESISFKQFSIPTIKICLTNYSLLSVAYVNLPTVQFLTLESTTSKLLFNLLVG